MNPSTNQSINSANILKDLINLGCSYEGAYSKLISINVPANIDLSSITGYLVNKNLQWEYADPTYEEINSVDSNKLS
jgi:broad specificity polyphosphatase/5'/3'-nucleotidase SurE